MVKKHGIKNLQLICGDFRIQKFDTKFNYIVSTGVIHHLDEPSTALDFFNKNLTDQGVIFLMVYGNQQSESIKRVKEVFKKFEFSQNKDSIESIKKITNKLHKNHPSKIFLNNFKDLFYDAGIVDVFLHPQEKFYSLSSLIKELKKSDLIIKNFADGRVVAATKFLIDNPNLLKKFRELSLEDQLDVAQILNWNDRKIEVICTKSHNKKYSTLYNRINLNNVYIYPYQNTEYKFEKDHFVMINILDGTNLKFRLNNNKVDWKKILSGQYKLKDVFSSFSNEEKNNLLNFIEFAIENYFIDFSFYKIENYNKYYNSY